MFQDLCLSMTALRQRKSSKVKEVGLEPQSQRCEHAAGKLDKTRFGQYNFPLIDSLKVCHCSTRDHCDHVEVFIAACVIMFSEGASWWSVLCVIIGSIVGVSLGLLCCIYVATLHENDLWFSNIKVSFQCNVSIM